MRTGKRTLFLAVAAGLVLAACATSPMDEQRRQERETAIDDILSFKLDPAEYGESKRCLSDSEFRSYRALDERHIVFKGRGDKLWVNTLRSRCPGLERDSVLIVRKFGGSQFCSHDMFEARDWFGQAGAGVRCVLGEFQPVTQEQIDQIEAVLDAP